MINKDRWEEVESIYHAALERDPDTRAAYLEEACQGDEELRSEVDSLLRFDGPAAKFIERPALELEAQAMAANENSTEMLTEQIGPYRLLSILSHGSMGDVFLAVDTRLDRRVVVKLLAPEFTADNEGLLRFKQEARATSSLSHPNIVTLYEIGEVDGHHYIVTEYVEGQTLRQLINGDPEKRIKLTDTLLIAAQILDALQSAHQAGVVHRDIKPENIVVRKDGLVKVLDFGIAKLTAVEQDSGADHLTTRTGIIMGTASYMSPEQVRGQKVDHRTDIFSLGALLYEMLSGERPFAGETMQDVMAAVLIKEPKPLDTIVEGVPPALQRIVQRCLEKKPEARFQTASDLAFSLKELGASISITANGEKLSAQTQAKAGFRKSQSAFLALAVFVAVIAIGAVLIKTSVSPRLAAVPAIGEKAPRIPSSTTRLVWFDRSGNQLGTVGLAGEYSGPALSPTEDRIAVALNDPRKKSRDLWIYPVQSATGVQLTADQSDDLNPVWTPDGRWIIYSSEKNGVRNIYRKLADGSGGIEPLLELKQPNNVEDISRNGRLLIFNTRNRGEGEPNLAMLSLVNLTTKPFVISSTREDSGRFSPDGSWVAYRSQETGQSEIFVRRISETGDSAKQNWRISNGRGGNTQPMWRGDGKVLYYLDHKVLTSVDIVSNGSTFSSGPPTPLFKVNIEDNERRNRFLVTKDGERFLVIVKEEIKL